MSNPERPGDSANPALTEKQVTMATGCFREEVLNVVLAQLLNERGLISLPETVLRRAEGTRLPDVRVVFRGLRTSIEGKYSDVTNAKRSGRTRSTESQALRNPFGATV